MPQNIDNQAEEPRIGPDGHGDVRTHRPYYLVRLGESPEQVTHALNRILADVDQDVDVPVSDIVIFCHGWHRRGWQALSVYDRLFSRIPRLVNSGRTSTGHRYDYNPIYVGVHWNSDIDEDTWAGSIGRRNQEEFKDAVRKRFPSSSIDFDAVLDRYYFLFADLATRGRRSLTDQDLNDQAKDLWRSLNKLRPIENANLKAEEKLSILWDCYSQSSQVGGNQPQTSEPGRFISVWRFDGCFGVILLAISGLYFLSVNLMDGMFQLPHLHRAWTVFNTIEAMYIAASSNILATFLASKREEITQKAIRLSFFNQLALLLFKLPFLLILLTWSLVSYICGPVLNFAVYNEMLKGSDPAQGGLSLSLVLSRGCLLPNTIWKMLFPKKSIRNSIISAIDSQCSFWQMQRKAAGTGFYIASLLSEIFGSRSNQLRKTRVHLVGHSFGGVAVSTAAHKLANDSNLKGRINSLCLVLPAISSAWFSDKPDVVDSINDTISCVFSRYDRANGVWFPLANGRKLSGGYVGLFGVGGIRTETIPPVLIYPFHLNPTSQDKQKHILNIDASHVMHVGPFSAGGHGHVFTDEAVYIIWSVTIGALVHFKDLFPGVLSTDESNADENGGNVASDP